jgi:type IV pilus assembly protein PilV
MNTLTKHSTQRGIGLFDALIAMVILSFGMLAMTRFQTRLVGNATEAQTRLTATSLADELLNTAMVDGKIENRPCYTKPQVGACPTTAAASRTADWASRVAVALPEAAASSVYDAVTGRMTVTIQWYGKGSGDTRNLEITSDVR